jgi:hypothetical protein
MGIEEILIAPRSPGKIRTPKGSLARYVAQLNIPRGFQHALPGAGVSPRPRYTFKSISPIVDIVDLSFTAEEEGWDLEAERLS